MNGFCLPGLDFSQLLGDVHVWCKITRAAQINHSQRVHAEQQRFNTTQCASRSGGFVLTEEKDQIGAGITSQNHFHVMD